MSAISEVASFWMEGAMRTIDAFRNGFGIPMDDPEPTTPSQVIYESGLVKLRYYEARGTTRHRVPLLLIYSLIKRPFILDLQPGRSVVEAEAGGQVARIRRVRESGYRELGSRDPDS